MSRSKMDTHTEKILLNLEARLAGTLKPVQPSGDIVQRLKERLHFPDREEIVVRLGDWRRLFVVLGGVMSGLLILMTVARAFFYFFGRKQV